MGLRWSNSCTCPCIYGTFLRLAVCMVTNIKTRFGSNKKKWSSAWSSLSKMWLCNIVFQHDVWRIFFSCFHETQLTDHCCLFLLHLTQPGPAFHCNICKTRADLLVCFWYQTVFLTARELTLNCIPSLETIPRENAENCFYKSDTPSASCKDLAVISPPSCMLCCLKVTASRGSVRNVVWQSASRISLFRKTQTNLLPGRGSELSVFIVENKFLLLFSLQCT